MTRVPRSLAGRALATAALAIVVALVLASFAIGHILGRFVTAGLDQRLDAQLAVVARAVRPDGRLDPRAAIDVPPFDTPGSGWAWQVAGPAGTLRSASLEGRPMTRGLVHAPPPFAPDDRFGPRPFEARSPAGGRVHGRFVLVPTAAGPVEVAASAPRRLVERPIRAAMVPLLLSVALLGILLAAATLVQLRFGLRPLRRVQAMLTDVQQGRRRHVDIDEPTELLPLVAELNALIDANEAGLARARLHVANLAHGLKTPLATLRLDLAEPGRDPDGRLATRVAQIEEQVRHHLGRARVGEGGGGIGTAVRLAPAIDDLVDAMRRLHVDRPVAARVDVPVDVTVRIDGQDLDEALGNILENAWRHAAARVEVRAREEGRHVSIAIDDDGEALPVERLAMLRDGTVPVDERGGGHGHGVRIARELIELAGGTIAFAANAPHGLSVRIALPAAGAVSPVVRS